MRSNKSLCFADDYFSVGVSHNSAAARRVTMDALHMNFADTSETRQSRRLLLTTCVATLVLAQLPNLSDGFQPCHRHTLFLHLPSLSRQTRHFAVQQEEEVEVTSSVNQEAARLRKEAELMRLQAEQMDLSLTLQKIESLEAKLGNKAWIAKHPDQEAELQVQLQRLNDKLSGNPSQSTKVVSPTTVANETSQETAKVRLKDNEIATETISEKEKKSDKNTRRSKLPKVPMSGFDQTDLDLYIPVAKDIDKMIPNGSIEEKLEAFRSAPELQEHFQKKIQNMLVGPLEEIQQLEILRRDFLDSTSSKEREQLKRKIERLEASIEDAGAFPYSEGLVLEDLEPMSDEELRLRVEAVSSLPDILVSIYKQRSGLDENDEVSLAIQMDYYEPQIQQLEQSVMFSTEYGNFTEDYMNAFNRLPKPVQKHYAAKMGIEGEIDVERVLEKALEVSRASAPLIDLVQAGSDEPPEYNDIEFVDRSRFLEEFFPAFGNMEGKHPSQQLVDRFSTEILDRKFFTVSSKPERVAGGWYIRGTNQLEDDEGGTLSAADKLVAKVNERMESSPLGESLEFFYIIDPSPPTDEEIEFGPAERPLFVVTTKDPESFYDWAKPTTKVGVSVCGLLTTFLFSLGSCALNPSITERFTKTLEQATETGVLDLQWFADLLFPMFAGCLSIQLVHEIGHRIIALRDKFDVGLPTLIPSITTGFTGAITPLRSPPPNSKSMFDFALAGPLAGMLVSLALLINGLELTSTMALGSQLPVVPVDLLRSSSLGGGLVEYFLGNTAILPDQGPAAVLPLHPYAIAGFVGLMTNALALLPLGHTDGGRIAVTMFGRRGAFVVKLFTALLLCSAGLFGLDDTNIFLIYAFFVLIWQRELESPARNEVDELDFPRGLVAIATALAVGLTVIPMF